MVFVFKKIILNLVHTSCNTSNMKEVCEYWNLNLKKDLKVILKKTFMTSPFTAQSLVKK